MTKLKLLLFAVFTTVALNVHAQGNRQAIEKDFNQYLTFLLNKEFDKSMDYMVEELFTVAPRASMIQVMESAFNNPEIDIALKDPKILDIGKSELIDGKHYALLNYSVVMTMRLKQQALDAVTLESVKASLEQSFGTGNVSYDNESGTFIINSKKGVYAVSKNGTNNWKFVSIEKEQKELMEKLLPKKLVEKI